MAFEWPIDRSCLPELPTLSGSPSEDEQAAYDIALARRNAAEDLAVSTLWALSGRQFGLQTVRARPCVRQGGLGFLAGMRTGLLQDPPGSGLYMWADAGWSPFGCGCVGACIQGGPRAVHLAGPVDSIVKVTVDGVDLLLEEYVLQGDVLFRNGGGWPGQHLGKPAGEVGTWTVDYRRGVAVPPGVDKLVGVLAGEFIKACDGDGECRIPRTVRQMSQRGVVHEFDPTAILKARKTGLAEVDLWLSAVNPAGLMQDSVVL